MKNTLLFTIIFLVSSGIYAQEEIVFSTDRPGFCYSPLTVSKGRLLLETGLGLDLNTGIQNWGLAVHDFRYGLLKNFELRTGVRMNGINSSGNFNDIALSGALMAGFKWGILNKAIQLAYVADVYVPSHPSVVVAQHSLNMSHGLGSNLSFNYLFQHIYDFGQLNNNNPNYLGAFQFSWMACFSIMDRWSFYLEASAQWDNTNSSFIGIVYDAGLLYMIKDHLQLDFFFGHGINYSLGTYGIGLCWMPHKSKQNQVQH